ncbi:MAG: fatty acid oxidation complex subunit alpha FadB [Pseudohongiellaceae bacterium]
MIFSGKAIQVEKSGEGIARAVFDRKDSSVNKFDRLTLDELREAVKLLQEADVCGVVFASGKSSFIVGADITEFIPMFSQDAATIEGWVAESNALFNAIEDLLVPTVCAIDGVALGGGFELAVATDYRVGTDKARVGFPEVKLGILPGFGGTVRLPRLIGADNANQWISSGRHIKAGQALKEGALDAIVSADKLLAAAEKIITQCNAGKLDYQAIRKRKTSPLSLQPMELNVAFETAKAMVMAAAGPHYPAPITAVKAMQEAAGCDRAAALKIEHAAFVKLAKSEVAANLVQMFLNDQFLGGKAKQHLSKAREVSTAAVLGAGIMGGGIAYQSALNGIPIRMKDVAQQGLDLGLGEAKKLLQKRVTQGRISPDVMLNTLTTITPTLSYQSFSDVDIVVEAVVENPKIKKQVLKELENEVSSQTVIATNTSTISLDDLATALDKPERFCGMHFFNPVPVMPLVEVIRSKHSSEETIATTVAYAKTMGKTPIVVNNCPGFLVNRILFPYFGAFSQLLRDGADFRQIDKAMEKFGWPMGPAYLLDVVGMDTAVHAQAVLAAGFARMQLDFESAIDKLVTQKHYGQKTGSGFYRYETDKRGKPKKLPNPDIDAVISSIQKQPRKFDDKEIVERMMLAMSIEATRCLEDGIVETAIEVDMGLVLGLGFPAFRGGTLRYVDSIGLDKFCQLAAAYESLGELYQPGEKMQAMAANKQKFYAS